MYKFLNDNKGFYAVITGVVTLVVAVIMIASVAMPVVLNTNQVGWPAATVAMWGIIPILLVVGIYQIIMGGK
jgi:hypothetical protein